MTENMKFPGGEGRELASDKRSFPGTRDGPGILARVAI
jgi:hypothetical protein